MKKILCLIDALSLGGAERQLIALVFLLRKKGYHVDLAVYYDEVFYSSLIESLRIKPIFLKAPNMWRKIHAVKSLIKNEKYDCVIAYKDGPTIIACLIKLLGLEFRLIVSERNTTQILSVRETVKFKLYRYADYVVPNSYSQKKFIERHFEELVGKTVIINNYLDVNKFRINKPKRNKIPLILTVGRIAKQKNILAYIEAAHVLKEADFVFNIKWIGNVQKGEEEYEKACKEKINLCNLQNVFKFYPATNNIIEEYQSCDFFCLPSIYEGYPNVICEAMSCGKPILCGDICDNSMIVKDHINGFLFNPNRVEDIVDKISNMLQIGNSQRTSFETKSRELAEKLFSEDTFVNKYINLIES